MPQDKESGAKANQYGLDCGKRIMSAIGASNTKPGSNECSLNGELLSVHCAHKDTDSIGVTYKALEKISAVLGAFEQEDGSYVVWKMPKARYEDLMTATRSLGTARGKVGIVKKSDFERIGTQFAKVSAFE